MRGNKPLWILAEEDAQRLKRMAESMRNPNKSALLVLGYKALEDLSVFAARGNVPLDVLVRLESLTRLFKLHGLPASTLQKYRRLVLRENLVVSEITPGFGVASVGV